jgi:hypothetical protein
MRKTTWALTLVLGGAPLMATAEPRPVEAFTLQAGDTVRMWDLSGARIDGRGGLVAVDHTGVSVVRHGDAEIIPFAALQRMEVRRGRRHFERGAWIGAAAAFVIYFVATERSDSEAGHWRPALGWTAAGAAAGAGVGAFVKGPRWHPVPLDRFRAQASPAARVSLRFRF